MPRREIGVRACSDHAAIRLCRQCGPLRIGRRCTDDDQRAVAERLDDARTGRREIERRMRQILVRAADRQQHERALEQRRIGQSIRDERARVRRRPEILERNRQIRRAARTAQRSGQRATAVANVDHHVRNRGPGPERMVGVIDHQHRRPAGHGEGKRWNDVPAVRVERDDVGRFIRELAQCAGPLQQRAAIRDRMHGALRSRDRTCEAGLDAGCRLHRQHDAVRLVERIARDPAPRERGMAADREGHREHVQPAQRSLRS